MLRRCRLLTFWAGLGIVLFGLIGGGPERWLIVLGGVGLVVLSGVKRRLTCPVCHMWLPYESGIRMKHIHQPPYDTR